MFSFKNDFPSNTIGLIDHETKNSLLIKLPMFNDYRKLRIEYVSSGRWKSNAIFILDFI